MNQHIPFQHTFEPIMFLFPRWDMLVTWWEMYLTNLKHQFFQGIFGRIPPKIWKSVVNDWSDLLPICAYFLVLCLKSTGFAKSTATKCVGPCLNMMNHQILKKLCEIVALNGKPLDKRYSYLFLYVSNTVIQKHFRA